MSTKRRGAAAAASPEVKLRSQKRRKVSDEDLVDPEDTDRASSEPTDPAEADESVVFEDKEDEPEVEFEGDSMQMAQDKILSELFRLRDDDGEEVAYPFVGKPDRNLYRDYYEVIQHPVSLRSIQKKVRGTDGRKKGTKMTAFPTWRSFEEEVSYLWRNAREYNEDGSDISILAGVMEKYFKERVEEAKKFVPDPIQVDGHPESPRIKLKLGSSHSTLGSQKLTLKVAGQAPEISKHDKPPSGVTVDDDSLKRQQELVRTGSTSQEVDTHQMSPRTRSLRRHIDSPKSSTGTTPSNPDPLQSGGREPSGAIKDEPQMPSSQRAELPFSSSSQPGSNLDTASGNFVHDTSMNPPPETSPMDSIWRRPGQDSDTVLIRNVQILTHSSLSLNRNFRLDVPPSSTLSQQTITIPLPPSYHLLTIKPTLTASTAQRQVKMIAQTGMQRLHPSRDASTLAYDIQLHPGTTKVDLEAIAGPARGAPKSGPPGSEVDYERLTIFFNLLR
ncbi:hypothetical protein N7456_011763 [Penicillium angulare]|uniref:Bromo domain-containing protein n=1 Tax=Penicillium angulare TaxID=116970 RepID=A0A9W9EUE5_9EURO|nr:hypothetical protein N7456_011763 [Penicillium angulare]